MKQQIEFEEAKGAPPAFIVSRQTPRRHAELGGRLNTVAASALMSTDATRSSTSI
uniref:Uncharacterized protein n=1 Tax=Peronospora matthiolae TaxID=2874970 RepID=A0AAV1U9K5_9STRA